jgi:aryl-alcohol dehydrogenase-like predicted oxidoreductase
VALAWNMGQPGITSPIVGPRTLDHWKGNLGALDVSVTDADRERLDAVAPPGRMIAPYYEAQWGPRTYR